MRVLQRDPGRPAGRRGRGRPRDPATDEKITKAAADLMLLRGYDRTTVDDVADRAGVGKATVYRRWPSKEDLAVAAMETLYSAEMPEPDTGSVETDLAAGYRSVLAFVNTPEGEAFLRTSIAESVRDDRIAALYRSSTERREQTSRVTFERAIARGEVRRGHRHRQRRPVAGRAAGRCARSPTARCLASRRPTSWSPSRSAAC